MKSSIVEKKAREYASKKILNRDFIFNNTIPVIHRVLYDTVKSAYESGYDEGAAELRDALKEIIEMILNPLTDVSTIIEKAIKAKQLLTPNTQEDEKEV